MHPACTGRRPVWVWGCWWALDACPYRGIHCESLISLFEYWLINCPQLLSVISLLSSDTPNLDSPANVDAAKEVRTDLAGQLYPNSSIVALITMEYSLQEESPAIGEAERGKFLGRIYLVFSLLSVIIIEALVLEFSFLGHCCAIPTYCIVIVMIPWLGTPSRETN